MFKKDEKTCFSLIVKCVLSVAVKPESVVAVPLSTSWPPSM
jgi:hypothetical protein